ncbi:hypothetical protein [Floccifex sp.]|uniref:hypothetical protein n=1 Tax=Floccifex sp. TaxID=2815810 RepID=UPI0029FEE873|nr:hypothetical protein [Floccifex sp.]MDD7281255.1 hypothetical protein [Erysipelotrichaceae bacterium]MDY2958740.1 hypothetical protein [Floccifex sp.]
MRAELNKYIEKPWGYEKWIAVTDHYALKEIFLKKGCRTSLQYHNYKEEHSYVLSGQLSIEEDNINKEMETNVYNPGDIIHALPTYKHRVTALEDSVFIEVSTPYLDDVVRVEDDYNRQ